MNGLQGGKLTALIAFGPNYQQDTLIVETMSRCIDFGLSGLNPTGASSWETPFARSFISFR
jgi:hypothetical protein